MKLLKVFVLALAIVLIVVMMAATLIEGAKGTPFVHSHIYGQWWFVALWALLAVVSIVYMLKKKLYRRAWIMAVHLSFGVILLGALLSWLTAESGKIHLRKGDTVQQLQVRPGVNVDFGFCLQLKDFHVVYYPGTDAAQDYVTVLAAGNETIEVSMNNIGQYRGYRFTQSSYDDDMGGSTLGVLYDPWGITVTYVGYVLLFVSLIGCIFSRRAYLGQLYRKATAVSGVVKTLVLAAALVAVPMMHADAQNRVNISSEVYNGFGRISVLYNGRVCPVNTVAIDFVTKLCGHSSWNGMSANEVFAGWVFDVPYWEKAKMVEIKNKQVRQLLSLTDKWASFTDFYDDYGTYKLEKPLKEAYKSGDQTLIKSLRDADEKFNVIRMLYHGEMLKMFPYLNPKTKQAEWYSPGQPLKGVRLPEEELVFVRKSMDCLAENVVSGNEANAREMVGKIYRYQHVRARGIMPSTPSVWAELFYNALNTQKWPVMLYITLALLVVVCSAGANRFTLYIKRCYTLLPIVMLAHISLLLILRWVVSGHPPLSNGYETMQFMAWATLVVTLLVRRRFAAIGCLGPVLASFALLVAMITDANPQITQLMPVLQSPLLSIHVMVIMFSYALLGLMALVGIQGLVVGLRGNHAHEEQLAALSRFLLYPAVALLAIGIFVGAIWANVSWGRYWTWDSKETWALITMLIYAAPLHGEIGWLRPARHIHIYMLLAFLSVLMTYFGVNYFLAGMHSYA